ncbi:hypothetical protein DYB36_004805 [Aphanomyces astaci]|uniref:DUF3752 domain-containing protein n=1 Tax=Aphanomyces astaci TaxID=112090 RepID=A0A397B5M8_APHAT|nr:hypothetical protein DYB36_004805 [Aphanomyces astaci]
MSKHEKKAKKKDEHEKKRKHKKDDRKKDKDKDMKARLAALFPLMGLVESGPNEAYSKHKFAKRNELLLDTFRPILQPPPTPSPPPLAMLKPKAAPRVLGPIGPSMPPPRPPHANDDDDDDVVGPALPGMKGFREASADVQERMRLQAEADDALAWKRVRGEVIESKPILKREEWMLSLPDDESIQAALGGLGDQNARKFRGRDKDERDDSWFASPAERDQAMREKAQWEMLGYVPGKPEVAEAAAAAETLLRARERMQVAAVPALPIARTDGDRSLLEKHQDALKKAGKPSGPVGWDRERDMASRRQLSGDAATALMQQAAEMSARFAAPKVTRTFL